MNLTASIIGEIVKKKYPAYEKLDNEEVGNKYLQKFKGAVADTSSNLLESANNILSQLGPITQAFGVKSALEKYSGGVHYGTDFGVPEGTKVATPGGSWTVVEAGEGFNKGYGDSVLIQNEDTGETLRFSHLSKILGLQPGQKLSGGQVFGLTGSTGNSTGPHLDLEYKDKSGKYGDIMKTLYGRALNG
jgi:murein DD-endopeptidase MepM/ murein hydrolase activator NlpD